jgi:predicted choloylglycine hydrolase
MNCIYNLDGSYAFNGNTTAYAEMEDGVNEHG